MKLLQTTLLTGLCMAGVLNAETKAPEAPAQVGAVLSETYNNKEKGYSIQYPSDWQKKDVPSIDFVLFAPANGSDAQVHASMNVIAEKVDSPVSLNQFYTESVANITSELKNVKVESSGEASLNGSPSKWVLYSHKMQDISFKVMQYFLVNDSKVYLLTFSALSDDFDKYRPDFEAMAKSFRLNKEENSVKPAAEAMESNKK